ncbi:MAG: carbonic anhydrase family protein [Alphaproteobacteria bacterium]|nr:carbonic anhydrase family protein [Alphaproteobacteria bacterium]
MKNNRRQVLSWMAAGAVACPTCLSLGVSHAAETGHDAVHWDYKGEGAPEKWGSLESRFRVCDLGLEQSPIDLQRSLRAEVGEVHPFFRPTRLRVLNNGHTVQVNADQGSYSEIVGQRYELLQFHFHHPSEHLLDGESFPLEIHFVHRSAAGQLAVLGVFFRQGAANRELAKVFSAMPGQETPERDAGMQVDPLALLPDSRGYLRYMGSLTTPPCSQGVLWTVFREPLEASSSQIQQFSSIFPLNARPIQPLNTRFLLENS